MPAGLIRVASAAALIATGCSSTPTPTVSWAPSFDTSEAGFLSSVWGSAPDDVFMVGGKDTAEIYHYDGATWSAMDPPDVGLLSWVFGFGPDQVYTVGVGGGVAHYDGTAWTVLDAGTDTDLWGVWGAAPDDLWIVGGSVSAGDPVIIHYDGVSFEPQPLPASENPLAVHALFKVFGVGSKLFAVGQRGLIIEYDGAAWHKIPAGEKADDDFISLWGTSEDHIVAVGGRNTARVAVYDGTAFETTAPPGLTGLNGVFVERSGRTFIGGIVGFVAEIDVDTGETSGMEGTTDSIHSVWGDDAGHVYAVGGLFAPPFRAIALTGTEGSR